MEVETDGSRQDGGGRRLRHLAAGRVVYVALESRRACDLAHRERERETLRAKRVLVVAACAACGAELAPSPVPVPVGWQAPVRTPRDGSDATRGAERSGPACIVPCLRELHGKPSLACSRVSSVRARNVPPPS